LDARRFTRFQEVNFDFGFLEKMDVTVGGCAHVKFVVLIIGYAVDESFLLKRNVHFLEEFHLVIIEFNLLAESLIC
jgi:hypothetical protein